MDEIIFRKANKQSHKHTTEDKPTKAAPQVERGGGGDEDVQAPAGGGGGHVGGRRALLAVTRSICH